MKDRDHVVENISTKPNKKQKKWMLEREQAEARADLKIFKRDFFENLPNEVCQVLDNLIWRWRSYDWFEEAWNKYRDHVLEAVEKGSKIKVPGYIFNDYIDDQIKVNFDQREELAFCHSDLDLDDYLEHWGIPGQKWGIRRFQNEDGTLTEAGKRRYLKGYADVKDAYNKMADDDPRKAELEKKYKDIEKNKNSFDDKKWDKEFKESMAKEKEYYSEKAAIAREAQNAVNTAAGAINTNRRGSKIVNKKDYSNIPDDEMRKRINRLTMEKQYGDLTGDNKYVMTGREKAKELLQTVGAVLGIAVSAVTVYGLIDSIRQKKFGNRPNQKH